jgi:ribonuclease VapC
MIVDTSALLAILFAQPEAEDFARAIAGAEVSRMSAANLLEADIVADDQADLRTGNQLDALVANFRLRIEPVVEAHVRIARQAYLDFGRGNHPAGLNFGDCFAYALAKANRRAAAVQGRRLRPDRHQSLCSRRQLRLLAPVARAFGQVLAAVNHASG